jgi:hypothetical protein
MHTMKRVLAAGLLATLCLVPAAAAVATGHPAHRPVTADASPAEPTLVQQVRDATASYRDVNNAIAAGFTSLGACVSGPEEGAMGIHYAGPFTNDGVLQADQPDLLLYELRGGRLRLLGVEYLQEVAGWTGPPPVLVGQQFQFVNAPNRYGLGAFYELHVWAWKDNPKGNFADWNPNVSCDQYAGEPGATHQH